MGDRSWWIERVEPRAAMKLGEIGGRGKERVQLFHLDRLSVRRYCSLLTRRAHDLAYSVPVYARIFSEREQRQQ